MYQSYFNVYYYLFVLICLFHNSFAIKCETKCCKNNPAVRNLQRYVQIDTSCGKNMGQSIIFLAQQAAELSLPISVYYPDGKPICVITWLGTNTSLPSIMLNSHADVVPAEEKYWPYPPFSGHIDDNCNMHARGTQDTKSVTIQYIEAIRKLIKSNITLQRTVHITVMPDEETGGFHGMKAFVKTKAFKALNIGFALDEGGSSLDYVIPVPYQDKRPWQMKFTMFGEAGHGSGMPNSSAMDKMYKLFRSIMKFREEQDEIRKQKDPSDYGSYTSININIVSGGSKPNVIPSEVSVVADMRLAVDADIPTVEAMVESWRTEAGNDTILEFIRRDVESAATPLKYNPYWQAMVETAKNIGLTLKPVVLRATSDMLVLRNMGIPAVGFAPRYRTPSLVHANDEYLNVKIFLEGIDVYVALLESICNLRGSHM